MEPDKINRPNRSRPQTPSVGSAGALAIVNACVVLPTEQWAEAMVVRILRGPRRSADTL
jgi:hypothetical protein